MPTEPPSGDSKAVRELLQQVTVARYFAGQSGAESKEPNRNEDKQNLQESHSRCAFMTGLYSWDESQTVWKARWTRTKAIYYINRILTLVGLTVTAIRKGSYTSSSTNNSPQAGIIRGLGHLAHPAITAIILTVRIAALYAHCRWVVRVLYSLLVLNLLVTSASTIHSLLLWSRGISYSPLLHLCATSEYSPTGAIIFISPASYEFILFSLTLYRAIRDVRNKLVHTRANASFLFTIYRDGFYYFAAVFAVHFWNSLTYAMLPTTGIFMGVYFAWAVLTVMSSRVYVNLVLAAYGSGDDRNLTTTVGFSSPRTGETYQRGTFGVGRARDTFALTTFSGVSIFPSALIVADQCWE
ncbi:hypothetical protein FRC16_000830 [Serendipita sp. 398]|nr:hypothetical protein FRC16_000830 [Serendipita sp. 398]